MSKPRVLVVEDEVEARRSLTRSLERAGYEVSGAATTHEGVALAIGGDFDALVLDLALGNDDRGGLVILERLRAAGKRTPCVLVTAFADLEKTKAALNLGASFLIEKPFRSADLVAVLRDVAARAADLSGRVDDALARAALTEREREIALLILKGLPSAEIAQVLGGSEKTVRQHITQIYEKCGVSSRAELFHYVFPF